MTGEEDRPRGGAWWLVAVLLFVFGAALRVQLALDDPGFDRVDPSGMLRTDPAELHYLGRRFVAHGGAPPDVRADPRIAWPDTVDVLRDFAVGQEWLVLLGAKVAPRAPLHVVATVIAALTAAASVFGVFGLALELARSRRVAAFAAAAFAASPAAYRTVGFVWVREDLALPLLAAASWAAARAGRRGTLGAAVGAGLLAAAAAATWHGAGIGLLALGAAIGAAALASTHGAKRSHAPALTAGAAAFAAACAVVPAAASKATALSAPVALVLAVALVASRVAAVGEARWHARLAARVAFGAALVAGFALARRGLIGDDLAHVGALFLAKLEHGGVLPDDPARVAPDVRLMWQGPFEGLGPRELLAWYGLPLIGALVWLTAVAARVTSRVARPAPGEVALAIATAALAALSVLAARATAFGALVVPVAFALAARGMARLGGGAIGRYAALGVLGVQVLVFLGYVSRHEVAWYRPLFTLDERRAVVAAVRGEVPAGAPVLTDFMTGPALLADHDRPIVLQPKWETAEARARVHRFLAALYHGSPDEFARYTRDEARCEWVLLDRRVLVDMTATRYAAGVPRVEDPCRQGTALGALLGPAASVPASFEVVVDIPAARGDGPAARLLRLAAR